MTSLQLKMRQLDEKGNESNTKLTKNRSFSLENADLLKIPTNPNEMIMTIEGATARIANAVEIRDMKQDRNFLTSYNKGGLGRNLTSV